MIRAPACLVALALTACGADVTVTTDGGSVESTPIDLCSCWAGRALESPVTKEQSCSACWISTIFWGPDSGVALCHYDQSQCTADEGCEKALGCVEKCKTAECVNQCITKMSSAASRSLFLDWSRCFCGECHDSCPAPSTAGDCPAGD